MSREDDFRIRPGRIRSRGVQRAKPFIAQALTAAQKAGGQVSRSGRIGRSIRVLVSRSQNQTMWS